jgi:5-dehydro-2-deoxygluconokinase
VKALRKDAELEQVHWATNRHPGWPELRVFAFDHRRQLEEMPGATPERIGRFKQLCLDAALQVQGGRGGHGILCDGRLGREALWRAAGQGLWIGRPAEFPGSRPLRLEPELGADFGGLSEWPLTQCVKVLCFCHPDDDAAMWEDQLGTLRRLFEAARRNRLELLMEVIPSKVGPVGEDTTPKVIDRIYDAGIWPDWWKLEPFRTAAAWSRAAAAIRARDPHTRGIVVLGLDAPMAELEASFALAAGEPLVKGFMVGRTIFAEAARGWLDGRIADDEAVAQMAGRYAALCAAWDRARGS